MGKYLMVGKPGPAAQATLLGDHDVGDTFKLKLTDEQEAVLVGAGAIVPVDEKEEKRDEPEPEPEVVESAGSVGPEPVSEPVRRPVGRPRSVT